MPEAFRPSLTTEQITENFCEIEPALTQAEALFEANRCLYCYDAPCTQACPTHINVPSFIKKIASGNLTGSARVILDANPIGSTCSRVCPVSVLCEGACVEKTLLQQLAVIVRGADTARLDLAPQAHGLLAISLGLSRTFADDHEMLKHGMVMYDALYAWCRDCQKETHGWPPKP